MGLRFFNGIELDIPPEWEDRSTVVVGPRDDRGINLVVKRRPVPGAGLDDTMRPA